MDLQIPDLMGLGLEEGIRVLRELGCNIEVVEYSRPGGADKSNKKIVRTKVLSENKIELVVCNF